MKEIKQDLDTFIEIAHSLLEDEIKNPVSEVIPAQNLYEVLDIELDENPLDEEEFKNLLTEVVLKTPKTSSEKFFNQLFGGRKGKAILGDLLAVMLNNSMYTYKVGGPQIGIEKAIVHKICELVGYGEGSNGTFAAGGSMSNYMAILMGRDAFDTNIRNTGVNQTLVAYTSVESHYSNAKNAAFAGIGRDNLRKVESNSKGEMLAEKLEEKKKKKKKKKN